MDIKVNTTKKHRIAAMLGGALIAGGAIAGYKAVRAADASPPPLTVPFSGKQLGFAPLVRTVKPAVVNIATTQRAKSSEPDQESSEQDMLRQFFGGQPERQQRPKAVHALGSGFIIDPHGFIVTNNHVIDGATDIQVTLTDGSVHPAHIVGRDVKTDLALLKINASRSLPYVAFGDSDKEDVGDWVIAVGNPFGLGGSVSAGIVSARNRDINEGPYDDFLQIDAPINPGNSGGPLFDQSGHVIGIDTAIYSPSGGSVGIGFAIPSNVAKRVVAELREHGQVARGWLGVQMQEMTPAIAKTMGLDKVEGVLVAVVTPNSPAARAGVRQGDVILSFNGKEIATSRDLSFAVAATPADKTVAMRVWRNGRTADLDVTIGTERAQKLAAAEENAAPEDQGGAQDNASPNAQDHTPKVGLELAPVPADARDQFGIEGGAVVAGVVPGSAAEQSGLQSGDVILRVGNHEVASPGDAASAIHAAEARHRDAVALLVLRDGQMASVPLQLATANG